jgi:hypothetical protein
MRNALLALGGLVVWAAHFFGAYLIASVWLASPTARTLTLAFTGACLATDGWLLWRTAAGARLEAGDGLDRWLLVVGFLGAALSALAVLWQGLPALFVRYG